MPQQPDLEMENQQSKVQGAHEPGFNIEETQNASELDVKTAQEDAAQANDTKEDIAQSEATVTTRR